MGGISLFPNIRLGFDFSPKFSFSRDSEEDNEPPVDQ